MNISAKSSYNLDMLCFFNTLTADQYYIRFYSEEFKRFYSLLSGTEKEKMQNMVALNGGPVLSPALTLLISSLNDFNSRCLTEMLKSHDEIERSIKKTPYMFESSELDMYFSFFLNTALPIIEQLEAAGFANFWKTERLPVIEQKCRELNKFLKPFDIGSIVSRLKPFDCINCNTYVCSFARPHGIKLCGNNLITDMSYPNETVLSNVTHEIFHPPYDSEKVKDELDWLAKKPWILHAFENQNPNSGYPEIIGFIEENVVEALGIYVLKCAGVEIDADRYFREHDGGSHVLSPHFYKYLHQNYKPPSQQFEHYFIEFCRSLEI